MQDNLVHKVKSNPKYHELISKRSSFSWTMAIIMLIGYYAYILTIAFSPTTLAAPLSAGSTMTVGIPIGIAEILFAFTMTGIYVFRANTVFDKINNEIKEEVL